MCAKHLFWAVPTLLTGFWLLVILVLQLWDSRIKGEKALLYLKTVVAYMPRTVPGQMRALISPKKHPQLKRTGSIWVGRPTTKAFDSTATKRHKEKTKRSSYSCKDKHVYIENRWKRSKTGYQWLFPAVPEKQVTSVPERAELVVVFLAGWPLCSPHSARAKFNDYRLRSPDTCPAPSCHTHQECLNLFIEPFLFTLLWKFLARSVCQFLQGLQKLPRWLLWVCQRLSTLHPVPRSSSVTSFTWSANLSRDFSKCLNYLIELLPLDHSFSWLTSSRDHSVFQVLRMAAPYPQIWVSERSAIPLTKSVSFELGLSGAGWEVVLCRENALCKDTWH